MYWNMFGVVLTVFVLFKASAKSGTGVCARGACTNLAVAGGSFCTKHKQESDENNAKVSIKRPWLPGGV
jgi:hypothetical protein